MTNYRKSGYPCLIDCTEEDSYTESERLEICRREEDMLDFESRRERLQEEQRQEKQLEEELRRDSYREREPSVEPLAFRLPLEYKDDGGEDKDLKTSSRLLLELLNSPNPLSVEQPLPLYTTNTNCSVVEQEKKHEEKKDENEEEGYGFMGECDEICDEGFDGEWEN